MCNIIYRVILTHFILALDFSLVNITCYTLYFTNWFLVVLLGATPAESLDKFVEWVDEVVASVATERCQVYMFSGEKDDGNYANLFMEQFLAVLGKFSKPQQWISDIIANNG